MGGAGGCVATPCGGRKQSCWARHHEIVPIATRLPTRACIVDFGGCPSYLWRYPISIAARRARALSRRCFCMPDGRSPFSARHGLKCRRERAAERRTIVKD